MRIRKQYQVIPTNAKLENGDSTSATNGYTAEYINDHSVVVSAVEPSGSARKKVWKQHSKNLFNKNNANVLNAYLNISYVIASNNDEKTIYIECKPNTTYTISKAIGTPANSNRFRVGTTSVLPANNVSLLNYVYYNTGTDVTSITITTPATAKYLCVYCWATDNTSTLEQMLASIQIEESTEATEYEPYAEDKEYILNNGAYEEFINNEPVVLWKNPSRTAIFSNQTITLNDSLANYKFYEVLFNRTNGDYTISTGRIPTDRNTMLQIFRAYGFIRGVEIASNTTLTIGEATRYDSYGGTSTSTNNNYCIPEQILGYK